METVAGWKRIAFVLCGVGVFKEFFPSAPFFVEYAMEHGNFTNIEVTREILPVTIYGHFVSLFIFLLITDLLRYRPVIILGGVSAIACWAITIFSYHTKRDAIVRQILYSIEHSSEVAYITFMYEIMSREYYKEITSLIHGSMHAGKFIAGSLGQILLSYNILSLDRINLISFAASVCVVGFALFLPGIKWSLYWHPQQKQQQQQTPDNNNDTKPTVQKSIASSGQVDIISYLDLEKGYGHPHQHNEKTNYPPAHDFHYHQQTGKSNLDHVPIDSEKQLATSTHWTYPIKQQLAGGFAELKKDIFTAYSNEHVARWSVWWAMSRAIYWQIGLFTESLWKQIEEETHQHPLNGAVDATHALISTLIAAFLPFIKVPWELWAEYYLAVIALVQGCMTLWMSHTQNLYIANVCYVIVQTTFEVVFIFGASEIAGSLPDHKASFIFGINALIGILIQGVITNVVCTPYSLALSIRHQFFVYGCYSLGLSLLFLSFALRRRHRNWQVTTGGRTRGESLTKF